MTVSYNLAYQEIIFVHPTRRQIFVGKPYFLTLLYFLEHLRPSHIYLMFTIRVGIVSYHHQLILHLCRLAQSSSLESLYREWGSRGD